MKTFSLLCDRGHGFDLMVKSAEALEAQQARGLVTCPYCDSAQVQRALSQPTVAGGKGRDKGRGQAPKADTLPVASSSSSTGPSRADLERAYKFLAHVRAKVEATHEDVGTRFTTEVRAMHYGETEERGIYGEASPAQVRDLVEEGIEIAPLPTLPKLHG